MKFKKIESVKPILALYDANAKKLIGIFTTSSLVAKYIFKEQHNNRKSARISASWSQKNKVYHNDMAYAIRTANEEQKQLLDTNEFIILNGYEKPIISNMRSFDCNRIYLNSVGKEKSKLYKEELAKHKKRTKSN